MIELPELLGRSNAVPQCAVQRSHSAELHIVLRSFSALNPSDVRAYLQSTGWSRFRELNAAGALWRNGAKGSACEVALPNDPAVGDFTRRMNELVHTVAEFEHRNPVAVLADLGRAGHDVLRFRLVRPDVEDGSVPLAAGVDLMESAKETLYASAIAAAYPFPKPYYPSRAPKQVTEFMESVRLGQTERGSYVVTLEAPVPPSLGDGSAIEMPVPYARRVTQTLASALTALRAAATTGAAPALRETIRSGASANLCTALSGALHSAGQRGEVEVRLNWAQTRPAQAPMQIIFPGYLSGVLQEAASLLKAGAEQDSFELTGTVHQIRQDQDAVILGWVDDRLRKVRLAIPPEYRNLLIQAFETRSLIRCVGELRSAAKYAELLHAREFVLLPDPD